MSYSNEEIKKWLDDAVKKIHESSGNADAGKVPASEPAPVGFGAGETVAGETAPVGFDAGGTAAGETAPVDFDAGEYASSGTAPLGFDADAPQIAAPLSAPPAVIKHTAPPALSPAAPQRTAPQRTAPTSLSRTKPPQPPATMRQRTPPAPVRPGSSHMSVPPGTRSTSLSKPNRPGAPMVDVEYRDVHPYDIPPDDMSMEQHERGNELDTGPEDFKMKFDFESAYIDVPEDKPLRLRREKRTGCLGGLLYSVFVICISLILASLAWMAASDILGFATPNEEVTMTVPKDFDIDGIIDTLYDMGLIKYKFLFRIYASYSHAEDKIAPGSYILNKNYDYRALVQFMTARGGVLVETTVTIPEGFTLAEIFTRLEDYGVCPAADLWEAATNYDFNYSFLDKTTKGDRYRLEGYLFPDTYNFYLDSSPVQAISKFLDQFNARFTETYIERAELMGYSIGDIITIASMIEREAGSDEERSRIAAVIYNRLNDDYSYPFLQIDATIYYAIAGTGRQFSTDIDNPYNTYLYEGLPPGPISNPGIESIRAALYPDSTDEYYYALNRQGTHAFFKTLAQHEAFVASDDYGGR